LYRRVFLGLSLIQQLQVGDPLANLISTSRALFSRLMVGRGRGVGGRGRGVGGGGFGGG
ncbi:hypothetical protein A2U01_0060618, partial [Trifolium medium]|nr:hypothetical protein [Trifolium medium]